MKFIWILYLILFSKELKTSFCELQYAENVQDSEHSNCSIRAVDFEVRDKISLMLETGKKIIFIHLVFPSRQFTRQYVGDMYQPSEWVRTVGRHGRSLLYLRPQFEQLSLTTLSLETGYIDVALAQSPRGCLNDLNHTMIEQKLRQLLLSDFKTGEDGSLSEHEHVCNMHIYNDNSYAKFFYQCCHRDPDGNMICQDMLYDFWIGVVFFCVSLINFITLMFSPYLIPPPFYRAKYATSVYEHKLVRALKIRIMKTDIKPPSGIGDNRVISIHKLKHMPKFYRFVNTLSQNKTVELTTNKILISVQYRRLLAANYVPVGVMKTFYNAFFKCNIRKVPSFGRCCRGSIFGSLFDRKKRSHSCEQKKDELQKYRRDEIQRNTKHPWYRYLKIWMRFIMLIGISLPWIIRIFFFLKYELPHTLEQQEVAEKRNLSLPFQWNLTNTLSPIHSLFLLCYVIFVFDALVLGIVSHKIKVKLQYLMRKCLRDMRDISRSKALEWSAVLALVPCEKFGILGIFLFGIYIVFALPVILAVLAFYFLPTVNLTLRLGAHFFVYLMPYGQSCLKRYLCIKSKRCFKVIHKVFHMDILSQRESLDIPDKISVKNRFLQLFVLVVCLLTVFSFALLVMEILVFFVEVFIYTIIGIIMNASSMLKYISLLFMLGLYARDCFKGISDKYSEFNKSINRLVVDMMREKVEAIASSDEQKNTAFQIETETSDDIGKNTEKDTENVKLIVKDGIPKWLTWRLVLFLDINDKPFLTEKFLFQACHMNTVGAPGPLIHNLVRATWRFLCICVFLLFVVLIVLAFGDEYQISGTNQMLATLAGGFLPWVFRNVLFKSKDALALDSKNLSFKSNFKTLIENYEQSWEISDIELNEDTTPLDAVNDDLVAHRNYMINTLNGVISDDKIPMLSSNENDERDIPPNDLDLLIFDDQVRETAIV